MEYNGYRRSKFLVCLVIICLSCMLAFKYQMFNCKVVSQDVPNLPLLRSHSISEGKKIIGDGLEVGGGDLQKMNNVQLTLTLASVLDNTEILCKRKLRLGNLGDGGWEVCDDAPVRPMPNNCLVYSFGINNDFSFDDKVAQVYGCQVHSFDPSMKKESHQRSPKVHFYKLGISNKRATNKNGWKLDTLGGIRKLLGHQNTTIDVLKMDVEGAEWSSLAEMLTSDQLKDVKQLLLEFHGMFTRLSLSDLKLIKSLAASGFRAFYVHKNIHCEVKVKHFPGALTNCFEMHYINTNWQN